MKINPPLKALSKPIMRLLSLFQDFVEVRCACFHNVSHGCQFGGGYSLIVGFVLRHFEERCRAKWLTAPTPACCSDSRGRWAFASGPPRTVWVLFLSTRHGGCGNGGTSPDGVLEQARFLTRWQSEPLRAHDSAWSGLGAQPGPPVP